MKPFVAALATAVVVLAAPAAASAATLAADPALACYREEQTVLLPGAGFTPNAEVNFSRDGMLVPANPPIVADGAGNLSPTLKLPGLISGERRYVYRATDSTNPAVFAEVPLRVTSTHVRMRPRQGRPNRLLRITARGFFGGTRLWAHIKRSGRGGRVRNVRIGRVRGACKETRAKRRLFPAGAASGSYRVQFDTHRRYRRSRAIKYEFIITIFRTVRPPAAAVSGRPAG
jgi:hypothetical protein